MRSEKGVFLLMTDTNIDFRPSDCSARSITRHGRKSIISSLGGNADGFLGRQESWHLEARNKWLSARGDSRVCTLEPLSDSVCPSVK